MSPSEAVGSYGTMGNFNLALLGLNLIEAVMERGCILQLVVFRSL